MSAFYATIEGNRGPATRCGSKSSGIKATAQSYDGSVIVLLDYNLNDELVVTINTSKGSDAYGNRAWHGTFNEFCELLKG